MKFVDSKTGKAIGSTGLGFSVIEAAIADIAAAQNLRMELRDSGAGQDSAKYRKNYRNWFLKLGVLEFTDPKAMIEIAQQGLECLGASVVNESGQTPRSQVDAGWFLAGSLVKTVAVAGSATRSSISSDGLLPEWVSAGYAEPGLLEARDFIKRNSNLTLDGQLLFALGAGAEFAPTQNWLDWGGSLAAVARPRQQLWQRLIATARASAGILLVPVLTEKLAGREAGELSDSELAAVAGLDLIADTKAIASWLADLSAGAQRTVLGSYAYAPGAEHIRVNVVQDALAGKLVRARPTETIALAWLATPTDSTVVSASQCEQNLDGWGRRSLPVKLRDAIFGLFGQLRPPVARVFETVAGQKLASIEASVEMQGPSYLLAKRSQRWRAYLAKSQGVLVSYQICPPARTASVLSHRILLASYAGAKRFGIKAFGVQEANLAAATMLVRDLLDANSPASPQTKADGAVSLHAENAIHGGLWRLAYEPQSVWSAATLLGLPALLGSAGKSPRR